MLRPVVELSIGRRASQTWANNDDAEPIAMPELTYRPGPESPTTKPRPNIDATIEDGPVSIPSTTVDERKPKHVEYIYLAATMWSMFVCGWSDGTTGPMLPAMQRFYHVNFTVVSMIFVVSSVGFLTAAVLNITLSQRLGFGKTAVLGALMQLTSYTLQAIAPPFPVFAFAYFFSGFGFSLVLAQCMDFAVSLNKSAATKMGILHGVYGIGAFVSPLVATQFAQMRRWSFHFLISVGCAMINVASLAIIFRFQQLKDVLEKAGQTARQQSSQQSASHGNHYKQILSLKLVHVLALFAFAYVGVEVTLGGWIVTFVIDERSGGPSSGYVSSGYWAGITVGRIVLLWVNRVVGERRVIWLYTFLSIGLEITIWLVPSLIANAVAVSFIGVFLGPMYPILMNQTGRLLPHWIMSGAVGWIAAIGQSGSAVVPFITGAMASKFGVMSLQPLIVTVLGIMLGLWAFVPAEQQRSD